MAPVMMTILLFGLGFGTTITFASSHWLLAWMGLEINTLAIIPLMTRHHHPRAVEAAIKYFLVQATAAATLLFASITNAWLIGEWSITQMTHPVATTIAMVAIAMKIGLAPLHVWLPEVLQGLDLTTGLILSTWQKLAPFALLFQMQAPHSVILTIMALASTLLGGWGGLNQTQLRKLLAYSSIAHLGWMILILQYAPSLTLLVLLVYLILTTSTFLVFKLCKATTINSLAISWTKAPIITSLTPLVLLSLGGLPPLTGFMPKWLVLQELTNQNLLVLALLAAFSALLSLFFYLRATYAMSMSISPSPLTSSTPWRFESLNYTLLLATSTTMALFLLPLTPAAKALLNLL